MRSMVEGASPSARLEPDAGTPLRHGAFRAAPPPPLRRGGEERGLRSGAPSG